MDNIVEYRSDVPPENDYPRKIVSPVAPAPCCLVSMAPVGRNAIDGMWRFHYKRCSVCGYTVRCFYAPSLIAMLDAGRQVRLALAEMNLGTAGRKRRTREEIDAERAAALRWPVAKESKARPARMPRSGRLVPSAA
jgi:hypothetical protein